MEDDPTTLRAAFVAAYPQYVAALLVDRGIEVDDVVADAIVEGASVLDGLLANLDSTPLPTQRQSPLELFREALRPVGRALDTVGVQPPESDTGSVSSVAWDTHMLSPASPAALGPVAHEAHLRWGVAKAQAMAVTRSTDHRPTLAVLCSDLDRQLISDQALHAGYALAADVADASFAIVDGDGPASLITIGEALEADCRTIVFGSQIDDIRDVAFRAQGVWKVVGRNKIMSDLASVLPALA